MKKVVGYVISIIGIAIMTFGFGMVKFDILLPEFIKLQHVAVVGIILIIIGVAISMDKRTRKKKLPSGENEIPIYEGTGKNRKIVGYRKH